MKVSPRVNKGDGSEGSTLFCEFVLATWRTSTETDVVSSSLSARTLGGVSRAATSTNIAPVLRTTASDLDDGLLRLSNTRDREKLSDSLQLQLFFGPSSSRAVPARIRFNLSVLLICGSPSFVNGNYNKTVP